MLPKYTISSLISCVLLYGTLATAYADIRVRCEVRSDRSKVSVDGKNLASGAYRATVTSGGVTVRSPLKQSIGDEVEFDFSSLRGDINKGAKRIPRDFIRNGRVTGRIYSANGYLADRDTVRCRVK